MFQGNVGYAGSIEEERIGERHGATVHAALGWESFVGAELGARATLGDAYNAIAIYGGLLATNHEDAVRFVLRLGINMFQAEWLEGVTVLGGGSPVGEVGLRIQLTGRPYETRSSYFPWGGTFYAAQGLFLSFNAGVQYNVRDGAPGEGFAFTNVGLSYAFGAEPAPN